MSTVDHNMAQIKPTGPLYQIFSPIKGWIFCATLLTVMGSILTLIPVFSIVHIVEIVLTHLDNSSFYTTESLKQIIPIIVISLVAVLCGMLLMIAGEIVAHIADNKLTHTLRKNIVDKLSKVPLGWFNQHTSGEVKQILQDDMGMLHSLTAHFYPSVGRALGVIVTVVIYLLYINWVMTLVVLLPFLGFLIFLRKALNASQHNMQDFAGKMAQLNSATIEFAQAMPIIKTFTQPEQMSTTYQTAVTAFVDGFRTFTKPLVSAMANAHAMISHITILGVILCVGSIFIWLDWINSIQLFAFALIAPAICAPVLLLHTLLHDLQASTGAAQRILNILETPVLDATNIDQSLKIHQTDISFEQVSYGYDSQHLVLSNLNFELKSGSLTAIVGASGAGKSTIAQLLLRFFDPTQGKIRIGGVELTQIPSSELYQKIGFVLQDSQLLYGTVRENIALGRSSATQQEIETAAKIAMIHEHIQSLELGYDTIIGQDVQFSGGERQRIAIARAVLLNPPIMVLDEPTAAVDSFNQALILQALAQFSQNRTLLMIAHRLDTVMYADQIIVLDKGQIVEQGNHQQLLELNGRYAQLWEAGKYSSYIVKGEYP